MLIEDVFEAVDRAFIQEAGRIPTPHRLELGTPLLLPVSAPEGSPTGSLAGAASSGALSSTRALLPRVLLSAKAIAVTHKRRLHSQGQENNSE
jgi:hypothetical protein